MKKVLALVLALAVMGMMAQTVSAQVPFVQVYFDDLAHTSKDCPGAGTLDTLLVVAHNFNIWMTAIEYSIQYPPSLTWLGDISPSPVNLGNTPSGVATAFPTPLNAFQPVLVMQVLVNWECTTCGGTPEAVIVGPHPGSGFLRATRYPDNATVIGVGMTSLVCPGTVPVQETTWGQVKALYNSN